MRIRKLIIASALFLPLRALADPAPIGLEIGFANFDDLSKKYEYSEQDLDPVTDGKHVMIKRSSVNFEGLKVKNIHAIFDKENYLVSMFFTLPKSEYEKAREILEKKYNTNPSYNPASNNMRNGSTDIRIYKVRDKPDIEIKFIGEQYKTLSTNKIENKN